MSFSVMPPTPRWTNASLTVLALEATEALGDSFQRALHVGLETEVQGGDLAGLDLAEDVFQLHAALTRASPR